MNIIDMEDITTRYAELRDERADLLAAAEEAKTATNEAEDKAEQAHAAALAALSEWDSDNDEELRELAELIEELRGAGGGDHLWEGDWFPAQLIPVDDFEDYAEELADDIGATSDSNAWPFNCIDWEKAARELAMDYSMVTYQDTDYYWR